MSEPCTKCGCMEHYEKEVCVREGQINLLPVAGFFQSPLSSHPICGVCGFFEFRVLDRCLAKVREMYPKAP